ncbi:MAG: hypothetical protein MR419_04780 [Clostridiales bacterium]|nr:hypothetical protein [Clostridiales bacterium]MDY4171393.1 hypothetical protein [Evtepia sp.]
MRQYHDFDLDIKKVQAQNDDTQNGYAYLVKDFDARRLTADWLLTSCSGHCR